MAQVTTGDVRLYKTAGPNLEEKILITGPVTPDELQYKQNTSLGERYLLANGFSAKEDEIIIITFEHASSTIVAASTLLKLTCTIIYYGIDGQRRERAGTITETSDGFTPSANVPTVETEIGRYQVRKGEQIAVRPNDQLYMYLATA